MEDQLRLTREDAVRKAQRGEADALQRVLERLAVELTPFAAVLCGGVAGETRTLVQDTLVRVYERLDQLRDPSAAFSWARRAMLRVFLNRRRHRLRLREDPLEVVVEWIAPPSPELLDLRAAVDKLDRSKRTLLVLHYWFGLTLPDIALELEIPEGTAKSRLSAALAELRRDLGGGSDV